MANGLQIQNEETNRMRSIPWITHIEFRTEYEKVTREEKTTTIEIVRVSDPDDETKVVEKRIPRETTRTIVETVPVDQVRWSLRPQTSGNIPPVYDWDRVARIAKNREIWPFIEPAYQAFKRNEEPPVDGMPLSRWGHLTPAQLKIIKDAEYKTVEDFATAPSGHLMKLPLPGILEIQKEAIEFLRIQGVMKDGPVPAQIAVQMTALDDENRELKARMAEMEEMFAQLRREENEPVRRGPGRPRKHPEQPEEAEAA